MTTKILENALTQFFLLRRTRRECAIIIKKKKSADSAAFADRRAGVKLAIGQRRRASGWFDRTREKGIMERTKLRFGVNYDNSPMKRRINVKQEPF